MTKKLKVIGLFCFITILAVPLQAEWVENGTQLTPYLYLQRYADAISDGKGGAIICWEDFRNNSNYEIYAQRLDADGKELWTPGGVKVTQSLAVDQQIPRICSDGAGGAIIVYQNNSVGNWNINAQRLDADGNILWQPGGVYVCSETHDQKYPRIAPDQLGGAVIAWMDYRGPDINILAQRIDSNGVVQWTPNGIAVCTAPEDQYDHGIVFSGHGGAIIAWMDTRSAMDPDIYAQRVYNGSISWAYDGVAICNMPGWEEGPAMCTDDNDGAYIVWVDSRNPSSDIYAQRINDGGTVQWTPNGIGICTAAEAQLDPAATEDGSGGAIIAWTHYDCSGICSYDIRAQRIDDGAGIYWTAGGDIVVAATKNQKKPKVVGDGLGGAIFVWEDDRFGDIDLFAQHLDASANKLWYVTGMPVSVGTHRQHYPVIVSDGEEGAIIAWWDERHNIGDANYDIYAQRMEQHGYWGNPEPHILSIEDLPHDQGGKVTVTWEASYLDAFPYSDIGKYQVYRSLSGPPSYSWALRHEVNAYELGVYTYTDNTTADSSMAGSANHHYKIRAYLSDLSIYWESKPDSGHSVDNTAPSPPIALAGEKSDEPPGLNITWDPNGESDLTGYAVYRGLDESFAPAPQNLIGSPTDPVYFDAEWQWYEMYYYKVSAIDRNGNESDCALLGPDGITGSGSPTLMPATTYLAQNYPNPFKPSTTIKYSIKEREHVSLKIYNAAGQLVKTLVSGEQIPRSDGYTVHWNGRSNSGKPVPSGVYFYRLVTKGFTQTKKLIVLK